MKPEPDYLSSVKYDNLDNIPFPPAEEVVEPHSIRNIIIRMLCWTALVPLFMLGFFQSQQIQKAMQAADDAQLAMVNFIAESVRTNVDAGQRVLQVLADVHGFGTNSTAVVQKELDRFVVNSTRSTLAAGAIFSESGNPIALAIKSSALDPAVLVNALRPLAENASPLGGVAILRIPDRDPFLVVMARERGEEVKKGRVSVALYSSDFIKETFELAAGSRAFDLLLVDEKNLLVSRLDRAAPFEVNHALENIGAERARLVESPSGFLLRTQGTRDVAQIKAYAQVPDTGWIVVACEPVKVRDQILLASLETSGLFFILAIVLTFIVGTITNQPLTRSINTLMKAVEAFGKTGRFNDIQPRLEKDGISELVELGRTFERMVSDVTESRRKLEALNAGLEAQVEERTRTLLTRNSELRALQRLLLPLEDKAENRLTALRTHVDESVSRFRELLDLPDLEFIASDHAQKLSSMESICSVTLSGVTYGWLASESTLLLTPDRKDSLRRLANSLAIVLANDALLRQLAKEHATLAAVFESVTDGIVILGRSGRILYANEYAGKLLNDGNSLIGIPGRQLIEKRYGESLPVEAEFSHKRLVRRTDKAEMQTIDAAGFLVSDLPEISGARRGWLLRDVSREAGLDAMKENLVSVVAHELKTPVTALRLIEENIIHRMKSRKTDAEAQIADAEELLSETNRLSQLIDDLLDVSRIEGGAMRLDKKIVQIASLIDRATRLTQARVPIHLVRRIDEDAEVVCVDPARFTQVFINLFVNAARYRRSDQLKAECRVEVSRSDGLLEIEVADFGQGIDPERLGRIFQPFYQSDMSTKRSSGGAGLGLTIVKGIVDAHQGSVAVKSIPGKSTVFTITLPA